jgi:hypothetical protein
MTRCDLSHTEARRAQRGMRSVVAVVRCQWSSLVTRPSGFLSEVCLGYALALFSSLLSELYRSPSRKPLILPCRAADIPAGCLARSHAPMLFSSSPREFVSRKFTHWR